jgi:hypothetical protein
MDPITPIWKPVSSKLWISSLWTPYLALVSPTNVKYAPIISGSSWSILCLSLAQLKAILSSDKCVTKRSAQCLPTGSLPRTPSSLSAISDTSHSRGANPRKSRSSIYRIIVCSLVVLSFRQLGVASGRCVIPLYRQVNVKEGTLNASAARQRLWNCLA